MPIGRTMQIFKNDEHAVEANAATLSRIEATYDLEIQKCRLQIQKLRDPARQHSPAPDSVTAASGPDFEIRRAA